jgi:opacity protein-like surface antigen
MKKYFYFVFVVLMVLSFSTIAQAEEKKYDTVGVYIGISGGYSLPMEMIGKYEIDGVDAGNIKYGFKSGGYLYGAKVGWLTPFTKRIMAMEFEYNHVTNNINKVKDAVSEVDADSKVQLDTFMFNFLARYPEGRFHPYVGVGVGYAYVKIDDIVVAGGGVIPGTSKGVFAAQFLTGIDINITKNFILGARYNYLMPAEVPVDDYINLGGQTVSAKMLYSSHNFSLNACFLF